jgi:predicted AAA+ superfamily ATPase
MKRLLYDSLLAWKFSNRRKPLLLQGARQVGKTYLVNQFGKNEYKDFIYLNFEQQSALNSLFSEDLSPQKIIHNISLFLGRKIIPADTLLFFDEIQAAPKALTSLKYFFEQLPEFHVIAAGSLLGVSVGKENSFPVGKVNFMTLYPMSFIEYLTAFEEELLAEKLANLQQLEAFPDIIHNKLLEHLKMYLFLGGMPEVLQDYKLNNDIGSVREIQNEILEAYKRDFSKYTSKSQAIKTLEIWSSIPWQLAREKKKFKYTEVSKHSRSSTCEQSIEWLNSAGLINLASNISVPKLPLSGYTDHEKFKIYLLDTGLLGAMLKLSPAIILAPTELFTEYNGAFTENFIASELVAGGVDKLFYWTSNNEAEVDFIIEKENEIYPLEVKSGLNRNLKSLRSYGEKYKPKLMYRLSPRNFIQSDDFINIPLYAMSYLLKS